jgi:drug/metabolite transporter (DMT)-like permease
MDLSILLLLLLSAVVHASWNLLSKRRSDKQAFLWLTLVAQLALLLVPTVWVFGPIPAEGWLFVGLSGALEAIYFLLLGSAYQRGDMSLVYPLARGSAPLFVLLFAYAFLNEKVVFGGIAGILLIVAGVYVLHVRSVSLPGFYAPLLSLKERPSQLALLTGLTIASYNVVDKVGVNLAPNPVVYLYVVFLVATVLLTPYVLSARLPAVKQEWRVNKASVITVAIMSTAAYLVTLLALTVAKVSYVTPVREVSVVFGALLGAVVLKEAFGGIKVAGSVLIFAGIVCIGLAR